MKFQLIFPPPTAGFLIDFFNMTLRMPAEWEPHEATWLAWPCNEETWPRGLEPVRRAWVEMARALAPHEKVHLLVNDSSVAVPKIANVEVHVVPNNDAWMRDAGPIFVERDGALLAHDFIFNTWGGKYGPWDLDDVIPQRAAEIVGCPVEIHDFVLEGGSIDVNGRGTLLTTRQCLLNKNRNPELSQAEIEERLRADLGATEIVWLDEGIAGDDTDGHIDDIARFVNETTIVAVVEKNEADENFPILQKNLSDLRATRFDIVELPMPSRVEGPFGRSPASYANFYIANGVVLVPVFNDPRDEEALEILRPLFPGRNVIGIDCRAVVAGLGAIHCVTQQQPKIG